MNCGTSPKPRHNRWHATITLPAALVMFAAIAERASATPLVTPLGTVLATFPFQSADFVADPNQAYMYASVPDSDSVAVINTNSATLTKSIALPGSPQGMAISPNGQTLYVADSSNNSIDVINTQTLSLIRSINVGSSPQDVAVGLSNRLYVEDAGSSYEQIQQIDATTGAQTGPALSGAFFYYGNLQMSPDQKTLYYGQIGLSPSTLYAFDVATTTPSLLRSVETGFNGRNAVLSDDGSLIAQPNGAPYAVTLYNASSFAALGTFNTGAYPDYMAFSPNGSLAYISQYVYPLQMSVYSTSSFAELGSFAIPDATTDVATDSSGRDLFVSYEGAFSSNTDTVVYATGVPEPSGAALLMLGGLFACCFAARKRQKSAPLLRHNT